MAIPITKDTMQKVLAMLIVSAITAFLMGITTAYNGAKDGTKARTENIRQQQQIDSLCSTVTSINIQLIGIYKELTETKNQFEIIDRKIDKIYELLILQK